MSIFVRVISCSIYPISYISIKFTKCLKTTNINQFPYKMKMIIFILWSMSKGMTKELVINAFQMAFWQRKPAPELIFQSDRGSQYASKA